MSANFRKGKVVKYYVLILSKLPHLMKRNSFIDTYFDVLYILVKAEKFIKGRKN